MGILNCRKTSGRRWLSDAEDAALIQNESAGWQKAGVSLGSRYDPEHFSITSRCQILHVGDNVGEITIDI